MRTLTLLTGTSLAASVILMAGVHLLSAGTANAAKPAAGEKLTTVTQTRPMVSASKAWVNPPSRTEPVVTKVSVATGDAAIFEAPQLRTVGDVTGSVSSGQAAAIRKASRRISASGARYTSLSAPIQRPSPAQSEDASGASEVYQQPIEFSLASR